MKNIYVAFNIMSGIYCIKEKKKTEDIDPTYVGLKIIDKC